MPDKKKKKELTETRLVHIDNATINNFWTDVSLAAQILLPLAFLAVLLSKKIAVYPFRGYVTGFWPSVNQQQRLLKWLTGRIPYVSNTPKKISQYWKDGSLLCTLINTVVPGACPNPQKHWKKPPTHAQALAYKYLGIPPVLSSLDFANDLDKKSENQFISYLYTLQEAINKLTIDPSSLNFTNKYIARGMGLIIGEQNKTSTFYIYPNADTDKLENIFVNIKGPYASFGKEVISAGSMTKSMKRFMVARTESARERKKLAYRGRSQAYLFRSLSFDLGPLMELWTKTKSGDINIKVAIEPDRAKIEFLPTHSGVYELLLTTNGEHFRGSPFVIRVTKAELKEEVTAINVKPNTGRRIISKTIDFIDESTDISEHNVMFLKIDQNNNNKTTEDNLNNEEIEYIEIVQKAAMKEVIYDGEIGDNIANARRDNREKKDLETTEEETTVEEKDSRELILQGLNEELRLAQKKMEERFSIMEEKCDELENLKKTIVNQLHAKDKDAPKGEDSVILQSFEIDPYSEEEREFERLYKESLYSNVKSDEDKSDSYPLTDSDSYIYEKPVKEPRMEDSLTSTSNPETLTLLEDTVEDVIDEAVGPSTLSDNSQIEEDLISLPQEDDDTFSTILPSNTTINNEIFDEDTKKTDILKLKEDRFPTRELELNRVIIEKDSGFLSSGSEKSIKDIREIFEKNTQCKTSPIYENDIASEVETDEPVDSAYPPLDDQLSPGDNQVNVFEIRLKFESRIQESSVPKKTARKPAAKLSTTKSLPNLTTPYKFDDETPFLNSSDSLNEFVLQFKEKKEFWDRLVENSSSSSLNSSMTDVGYQKVPQSTPPVCEDLPTGVLDRIRVFEKDFDSKKCTNLLKRAKQKSSLRSLTSFNSIKNTQELADIPLVDHHVEENLYFAEEMKKRFESARSFFRTIERSSSRKSKLQRHFSCEDREIVGSDLPKRSESMRSLTVLDRFSLDNLYRDVMLSKMRDNGSFRGSPNKSKVTETLASMSSTESGLEKDFGEDEDLDLTFFNAKRRTKHRRSIKSVFEVNY